LDFCSTGSCLLYLNFPCPIAAAIKELNAMVPELYPGRDTLVDKFSLDEIRILLGVWANPQESYPSLLIAGTNGKAQRLPPASILTALGFARGYIHLRILPRPTNASEWARPRSLTMLCAAYFQVHDRSARTVAERAIAADAHSFEILTAQALLYFAEEKAEIAVLEVGMGGRLDATMLWTR